MMSTRSSFTPPIAKAAPYVRADQVWQPDHLRAFLEALPPAEIARLKQCLGMDEGHQDSVEADARAVEKQALWVSSNVLTYPFRDRLDPHAMCLWVLSKTSPKGSAAFDGPTFFVERELQKRLFAELWSRLNEEQRVKLLQGIDKDGSIKDKAAIAAMSGAAAVVTLSATTAFAGFAFYTTMSTTIAAVAAAMGVTLPFAVYAGASTVVGILSGPIGWAVVTVAALGGLALAGRANVQKTTAFVMLLHSLKVEALMAAGVNPSTIFDSPSDTGALR